MPKRLRVFFAILVVVTGLAAVQAVFMLLQEKRGDAVRREFEHVVDDAKLRGARIDSNALNATLSEMMRFGLIRCFQMVETAPLLAPNFPATSDCTHHPIETEITGKTDDEVWAVRFEVLQPQEVDILFWVMRILVVTSAVFPLRFFPFGRRPKMPLHP